MLEGRGQNIGDKKFLQTTVLNISLTSTGVII